MSKILELAKKLKTLSERGVGGEAENAATMLSNLMDKHNISIEQLEEIKRQNERFKINTSQIQLFGQVAHMVGNFDVYEVKDRKSNIMEGIQVSCTKAEYLELSATFDFYWSAYEKEQKIFYQAFVQKNNIFPVNGNEVDVGKMSEEERKEALEVLRLSLSLNKHHFNKTLKK